MFPFLQGETIDVAVDGHPQGGDKRQSAYGSPQFSVGSPSMQFFLSRSHGWRFSVLSGNNLRTGNMKARKEQAMRKCLIIIAALIVGCTPTHSKDSEVVDREKLLSQLDSPIPSERVEACRTFAEVKWRSETYTTEVSLVRRLEELVRNEQSPVACQELLQVRKVHLCKVFYGSRSFCPNGEKPEAETAEQRNERYRLEREQRERKQQQGERQRGQRSEYTNGCEPKCKRQQAASTTPIHADSEAERRAITAMALRICIVLCEKDSNNE